jgi:uncharacterized protein (TIGR03437 family)
LNGTISTYAGTGTSGNTGDGGSALLSTLNGPTSLTFDAFGNLYIADTGNARIRMVTPGGIIRSVPVGALVAPAYMVFDQAQNLYIADASAILRVTPAGTTTTVLGGLISPRGMVIDASGHLYFSEPTLKQVWMLTPSGSLSLVGSRAWSSPQGIAIDASGNLLVADSGLAQVLSVNPSGDATVVAGTGTPGFGGDGDSSLIAQLSGPSDVLVTSSGVYIADSANNRVRQLVLSASQPVAAPITLVSAVNAASLTPGAIVPGMLIALLGTGLTFDDITQTNVQFNTISVPILSITPTEVLVRVPVSLEGVSTVQISINHTAAVTANVVDCSPALFGNASGQASVINGDGTLNSATNPATRGSIISLFGTGEGITRLPFEVAIGGFVASVLYAGPAGNYPGMFQINARVPSEYLSSGTFPVEVVVGSFATQPGLTISVF